MRLHRLEVTAFGPFADTATVDFDALSAAGLFLLSGATGAGKTSVLDAVCFALYGGVPGERNDAKRLRSDQAGLDTPPRVVLDATLAGRRFRIVRSPAWSRPKKRGSGTTPQQASVVISERVDGAWVPLSTRLDETGHLVTGLVGMNLTQFTQVAMLPQGRFQAFLRASSEDRHRAAPAALPHRAVRAGGVAGCATGGSPCTGAARTTSAPWPALVHRVSETAEASTPPPDESPLAWSAQLTSVSRDLAAALAGELGPLRDAELSAREALEAGRATAQLRDRHAAAARERSALVDRADEMSAPPHPGRRSRPGPGRRPAAPGRRGRTSRLRRRGASHRAGAVRVGAPRRPARSRRSRPTPCRPCARRLPTPPRSRAILLPRERERADLAARLRAAQDERGDVDLDHARARAAEARAASARLPAARAARDDAVRRVDACRTLHAVRNDLVAAQLDLNAVVSGRLRLVEELVILQQARLEGMAAEIASQLAVGASCPVCGSEHHPHLAHAGRRRAGRRGREGAAQASGRRRVRGARPGQPRQGPGDPGGSRAPGRRHRRPRAAAAGARRCRRDARRDGGDGRRGRRARARRPPHRRARHDDRRRWPRRSLR